MKKRILSVFICLTMILTLMPTITMATLSDEFTVKVNDDGHTFTISRIKTSEKSTINYRTQDESAIGGIHYTASEGTLTFDVGEDEKDVDIEIASIPDKKDVTTSQWLSKDGYRYFMFEIWNDYTEHKSAEGKISGYSIDTTYFNQTLSIPVSGSTTVTDDGWYQGSAVKSEKENYGGWVVQSTEDIFNKLNISVDSAGFNYLQANDTYKLGTNAELTIHEEDDGYQHIQFNTFFDRTKNSFIENLNTGSMPTLSNALYYARYSHYQKSKNSDKATYCFPLKDKSQAGNAGVFSGVYPQNTIGELVYEQWNSFNPTPFCENNIVYCLTSINNEKNYAWTVNASGSGDDDYVIDSASIRYRLVDDKDISVLDVYAPNGAHDYGDNVTVAVRMNKIVKVLEDENNSPKDLILYTNWGNFVYSGGSGSDTLYFSGKMSGTGYYLKTDYEVYSIGKEDNTGYLMNLNDTGKINYLAVNKTALNSKNDFEAFAITASAGENGLISQSGNIIVKEGENKTFTFTPASGYEIDTLSVDGEPVQIADSYTFNNVENEHTINVTFKLSPVNEQYQCDINKTYYFDLSNQAGTINEEKSKNFGEINVALPDTTLHYVPFTYVGTINAYVLKGASENATNDAQTASQNTTDLNSKVGARYNHSLFICDYNISCNLYWKLIHKGGYIFGIPFDDNYILRTLSVGGSKDEGNVVSPSTNEWDSIIEKSKIFDIYGEEYIHLLKNYEEMASLGQETVSDSPKCYASRGGFGTDSVWSKNAESDFLNWRPALEVDREKVYEKDDLNEVTLNLNGGSFDNNGSLDGGIVDNISIICAGKTYTAPSGEGLTPPNGKIFDKWQDECQESITYKAGQRGISKDVSCLKALWKSPHIDSPQNLSWKRKIATWGEVENSRGYYVQLYKNGIQLDLPVLVINNNVYDFTSTITDLANGSYTFTVIAVGDGINYSNSEESVQSTAYTYTPSVSQEGDKYTKTDTILTGGQYLFVANLYGYESKPTDTPTQAPTVLTYKNNFDVTELARRKFTLQDDDSLLTVGKIDSNTSITSSCVFNITTADGKTDNGNQGYYIKADGNYLSLQQYISQYREFRNSYIHIVDVNADYIGTAHLTAPLAVLNGNATIWYWNSAKKKFYTRFQTDYSKISGLIHSKDTNAYYQWCPVVGIDGLLLLSKDMQIFYGEEYRNSSEECYLRAAFIPYNQTCRDWQIRKNECDRIGCSCPDAAIYKDEYGIDGTRLTAGKNPTEYDSVGEGLYSRYGETCYESPIQLYRKISAHTVTLSNDDTGIIEFKYSLNSTNGKDGTWINYNDAIIAQDNSSIYIKAIVKNGYVFNNWAEGITDNVYKLSNITSDVTLTPTTMIEPTISLSEQNVEVKGLSQNATLILLSYVGNKLTDTSIVDISGSTVKTFSQINLNTNGATKITAMLWKNFLNICPICKSQSINFNTNN